jgi:uncharacterized Ntn-hydrolase superfamily protein
VKLAVFLLAMATAEEPYFATFSIAAYDPATGEVGVAVTTRNPCVGNAVPWVRAGVGAVATQASTRPEYGAELLDSIASGLSAEKSLEKALAQDDRAAHRQIGVIGVAGPGSGSAQHTGSETRPWSGHRAGTHYVTQGNLLTGAEVLDTVARTFEASERSGRHLADRLIEALAAGNAAGGDARKGRAQSAAVVVADPREGRAQRPDGVSTHVNVCEHPEPVAELRRIYDSVSQSLGYRTLQVFAGRDVLQLKIMLGALGYLALPAETSLQEDNAVYTDGLAAAVDAFRKAEGLSTPESGSPSGLVDRDTVARLWSRLEESGKSASVRERIRELTAVTR